jgi:hypothetical protein
MSAIMLSDKDDKDIPQSPLEKVITMWLVSTFIIGFKFKHIYKFMLLFLVS